MPHLDPELLALLALGEDAANPDERAHLRECVGCADEAARLRRPVAVGRSMGASQRLERPDARVWAGIAAELGLDGPLREDPLAAPPHPVARLADRPRRRRWTVALAAAAAVLAVAAVGIGVQVARSRTEPLADATLRAFPAWTGERGTAVLERRPDGARVVRVSTSLQPGQEADHEVWLMTANAARLVSLGFLRGTDGSFVVPAGVDLGRFDVVDVSDEPHDGNPAHSGDSILRGMLHA